MISKADYPNLCNFIAAYFHQDCRMDNDCTYADIVDSDLAKCGVAALEPIANESAKLLATSATEDELRQWLGLAGLEVILEDEQYTPRTFLAMIEARIRASIAKRP